MAIVPTMRGNGNCGCSCGNLPYTVTVSLAGVAETDVQTGSPTFSLTSCTGAGAVAVATAASGEGCKASDTTITGLTVTDGGCGYAVLGRKEPVLVASAPGGRGITFGKITLSPVSPADCSSSPAWTGLPQWKVTDIEATFDDPSGYGLSLQGNAIDWEKVELRAESGVLMTTGNVPINSVSAALVYEHEPPVLSAVVRPYGNGRNGSGATLTPQVTKSSPDWAVSSVTVDAGGDGYITGQVVDFIPGQDSSGGGAGTVTAGDTPPSRWFGITERTTNRRASGAALEFGWQQSIGGDGLQYWTADSVSVVNGGSRYTAGDSIIYRHTDGGRIRVLVNSVDAAGAIQSASVTYAWPMLGEGGPIQSVAVTDAGQSYRLRVTGIGKIDATPIYQEDPSLPALVPPTVISPNCTHTATIDDKVGSATFGEVTAVTVEDREAWGRLACAGRSDTLGGPHVLRATNPKRLVTVDVSSCWGASTRACIDLRTTRRVAPEFPDDVLVPLGEGCTPATVDYTLEEHEDDNGDPYWSIATVTASGGYGYGAARVWHRTLGLTNYDLANLPCAPIAATTSERSGYPADETPGFFVAERATLDITVLADSSIGGVTVTNGGKYYRVAEHDGQPTGIKKAHVTNPGWGYAKVGRDEPTLTVTANGQGVGSGLTITPTLVEQSDNCGLPYWTIDSVSVSGGTNYVSSNPVNVTVAAGDVVEVSAVLQLQTSGTEEYNQKPSLTPYVDSPSGSGAVLKATLTPVGSLPLLMPEEYGLTLYNGELWTISQIEVVNGGSGYQVGEYVFYYELPGYVSAPPLYIYAVDNLAVIDVDKDGAITKIGGLGGEPFNGGRYFLFVPRDTTVTGVTIKNGGKYYHENKSLPPYVSATATIVQLPPSAGSGASISIKVHDDPNNVWTFGRIKSATVDDEGSGYTLLGGPMDCTYTGHCASLKIQGPHEPLRVNVAESSLLSTAAVEDCGSLPSSATVQYGNGVATASVTAGGVWENCPTRDCGCDTNGCCRKHVTGKWPSTVFTAPCSAGLERSMVAYVAATDSCDCEEQGGEWVVGRKCGCCCVDGQYYIGWYQHGVTSPTTPTPCQCAELGGHWLDGEDCASECSCNIPDLSLCTITVNGSTNVSWYCSGDPVRVIVDAYVPNGAYYPVVLSAWAPLTIENCEYQIGEFTVETEGDFTVSAVCNPLP